MSLYLGLSWFMVVYLCFCWFLFDYICLCANFSKKYVWHLFFFSVLIMTYQLALSICGSVKTWNLINQLSHKSTFPLINFLPNQPFSSINFVHLSSLAQLVATFKTFHLVLLYPCILYIFLIKCMILLWKWLKAGNEKESLEIILIMFGCDHDDRIFMIGPSWGWDMPQLPVFVKISFRYLQSSKFEKNWMKLLLVMISKV